MEEVGSGHPEAGLGLRGAVSDPRGADLDHQAVGLGHQAVGLDHQGADLEVDSEVDSAPLGVSLSTDLVKALVSLGSLVTS